MNGGRWIQIIPPGVNCATAYIMAEGANYWSGVQLARKKGEAL
jgi:hypothetical protein